MSKILNAIQVAWVKALRGGEYDQGTGRLRSGDDLFCCLGVACDIVANDEAFAGLDAGGWSDGYDSDYTWEDEADTNSEVLTIQMTGILDLIDDNGSFTEAVYVDDDGNIYIDRPYRVPTTQHGSLTAINDETHSNFRQIGDFIEEHPEVLFKALAE